MSVRLALWVGDYGNLTLSRHGDVSVLRVSQDGYACMAAKLTGFVTNLP